MQTGGRDGDPRVLFPQTPCSPWEVLRTRTRWAEQPGRSAPLGRAQTGCGLGALRDIFSGSGLRTLDASAHPPSPWRPRNCGPRQNDWGKRLTAAYRQRLPSGGSSCHRPRRALWSPRSPSCGWAQGRPQLSLGLTGRLPAETSALQTLFLCRPDSLPSRVFWQEGRSCPSWFFPSAAPNAASHLLPALGSPPREPSDLRAARTRRGRPDLLPGARLSPAPSFSHPAAWAPGLPPAHTCPRRVPGAHVTSASGVQRRHTVVTPSRPSAPEQVAGSSW